MRLRILAVVAATASLGLVGGTAAAAGPTGSAGASAIGGTPIQHVVVIYQENHSFDNLLGRYCVENPGQGCDGAPAAVPSISGRMYSPQVATDIVPDVAHTRRIQVAAIDGGRMDGWTSAIWACTPRQGLKCLQELEPGQIPTLATLAAHGVVNDRTFSVPDPSAEAHLGFLTGDDTMGFVDNPHPTTGYVARTGWGCDSTKSATWISPSGVPSSQFLCNADDPTLLYGGAAGATLVPPVVNLVTDRLDPAGVSWLDYGSCKCNADWKWNLAPYHAAALHYDATHNVPASRILTDAATGNLPNVSFVTPAGNSNKGDTSQHNLDSMLVGDNWMNQIVSALQSGPDWSSTAVFITYDDCGCFYDHVPPPANLSVRVPLVLVSPWAKAGTTDHNTAEFASIITFIERNFGLAPLSDCVDAPTSCNPSAHDGGFDFMSDFAFSNAAAARRFHVSLPPRTPIPPGELRWLRRHAHDNDDDST